MGKGPLCAPEKKHEKPSGPIVEFYFAASGQYRKGERIPVSVNGHRYVAVVGQKNSLPSEVVEVLQEAKSRTLVPDVSEYDPAKRGMPRKEEDFFNPKKEYTYQSDFDLEILNIRD
jgi:hypothetical protein